MVKDRPAASERGGLGLGLGSASATARGQRTLHGERIVLWVNLAMLSWWT